MLRKDELIDQESYKFKIKAEQWEAKADKYRYDAYTSRSKVNDLHAEASKLKAKSYKTKIETNAPGECSPKKK